MCVQEERSGEISLDGHSWNRVWAPIGHEHRANAGPQGKAFGDKEDAVQLSGPLSLSVSVLQIQETHMCPSSFLLAGTGCQRLS